MQKPNREALKKALEYWEREDCIANTIDAREIYKAAQALYDITAPDYVITWEMHNAANNCENSSHQTSFRAMVKELVE